MSLFGQEIIISSLLLQTLPVAIFLINIHTNNFNLVAASGPLRMGEKKAGHLNTRT